MTVFESFNFENSTIVSNSIFSDFLCLGMLQIAKRITENLVSPIMPADDDRLEFLRHLLRYCKTGHRILHIFDYRSGNL